MAQLGAPPQTWAVMGAPKPQALSWHWQLTLALCPRQCAHSLP